MVFFFLKVNSHKGLFYFNTQYNLTYLDGLIYSLEFGIIQMEAELKLIFVTCFIIIF